MARHFLRLFNGTYIHAGARAERRDPIVFLRTRDERP